VARVGGDEFAAILIGIDADQASHVAERMRTAMHIVPVPSGRAQISVGWAAAPAGADPATVWALADDCLYEAKKAGRDRVVGRTYLGADGPHESTPSYTELLSQVLEGRRIHSMYQPILDLEDGAIIGYEALARPEGFAPTDSVEGLFDMARRSGRMRELDWLCRRVAIEQAAGLPAGSLLFLNTSGVLLLDPLHDVDQMLLLLEAAGRSPSTVVLEITERDNVRDLEGLAAVMKAHRDAGFAFALDDVGEGHSTIELLATAGAEYVKVGRSLTMTASRGRTRSAIEATLAFAHTTRAHVIAEGVENEFASDQMRDLDIRLGQGFGLGLPVEAGKVIDTMADWRTRAALSPLRPRSLEPRQST
jgi:EAL domain-containing protein (putative c-di-GMP-specific phosphodiesterase class I)